MKIAVKIKQGSENNRMLICRSLGIVEFEYRRFRRDEAFVWLANHFDDGALEEAIALIPLFWIWWNNQWDMRDSEFIRLSNVRDINEVLTGLTRNYAISLYSEIHDSTTIIVQSNVWLNIEIRKVLEKQIEKMSKQNG